MATVNNVVAVVLDTGVSVSGINVNIQMLVMTDNANRQPMQMGVTVPISNTTGQLNNALFTAIQASLAALGDNMPSNASLMVLGGRT